MYRRSVYSYLLGIALQARRLMTGNVGQSQHTKYLESTEYLPNEQLKKMQSISLCRMMQHAVENVPYYKSLKNDVRLTLESAFKDIKKFPIVNKKIIASDPEAFIDKSTPYMYKMGTGGTSKIRIEVMRDKSSFMNRTDEYFNRMMGIYPGMSRMIFSITERDYRADRHEYRSYHKNHLMKTYYAKPMPLNEEKLSGMYKFYIRYKPVIMKGNPFTIAMFAKYIEDNELKRFSVPIIRCYGLRLMPEYRRMIKSVFNTEVIDSYGSTETNFIASQCEKRKGMHYMPSTHYIECLDDNGREVEKGLPGSLVITSLSHYAMPIIRYEIGDYGTISNDKCDCGRSTPVIKAIHGRIMENITIDEGSLNIREFDEIMCKYDKLFDYQGIQSGKDSLIIKLVKKEEKLSRDEEMQIIGSIRRFIGHQISITFEYCDTIEMEENAKIIRLKAYGY